MNFLNNFQSELISQTSIVHYIEFQFEQELNKVRILHTETHKLLIFFRLVMSY